MGCRGSKSQASAAAVEGSAEGGVRAVEEPVAPSADAVQEVSVAPQTDSAAEPKNEQPAAVVIEETAPSVKQESAKAAEDAAPSKAPASTDEPSDTQAPLQERAAVEAKEDAAEMQQHDKAVLQEAAGSSVAGHEVLLPSPAECEATGGGGPKAATEPEPAPETAPEPMLGTEQDSVQTQEIEGVVVSSSQTHDSSTSAATGSMFCCCPTSTSV